MAMDKNKLRLKVSLNGISKKFHKEYRMNHFESNGSIEGQEKKLLNAYITSRPSSMNTKRYGKKTSKRIHKSQNHNKF